MGQNSISPNCTTAPLIELWLPLIILLPPLGVVKNYGTKDHQWPHQLLVLFWSGRALPQPSFYSINTYHVIT